MSLPIPSEENNPPTQKAQSTQQPRKRRSISGGRDGSPSRPGCFALSLGRLGEASLPPIRFPFPAGRLAKTSPPPIRFPSRPKVGTALRAVRAVLPSLSDASERRPYPRSASRPQVGTALRAVRAVLPSLSLGRLGEASLPRSASLPAPKKNPRPVSRSGIAFASGED